MRVFFKESFLKDIAHLPPEIRKEVERISTSVFSRAQSLREMKEFRIKPLQGFRHYYRIKLGSYRIGFKKEGGTIVFMRVLDRKDIYKHFP